MQDGLIAGLATFAAGPLLERIWNVIQVLDAAGLALFCVTGAAKALEFRLGPAQAIILGAITGIGGGMLRDVLIRQIPTVGAKLQERTVPGVVRTYPSGGGISAVAPTSKSGRHWQLSGRLRR